MEPTNEVKIQIIRQQIADWEAQAYSLAIQHKVQKRLESKPGVEAIEKQLVKCEIALEVLGEELANLNN